MHRLESITAERVAWWALLLSVSVGAVSVMAVDIDKQFLPLDCLPIIVAGVAFLVAFWNYANPEHWEAH